MKPSLLQGVFVVSSVCSQRSQQTQESAVHLCRCQTGIGFESRNQRAFIVHGYICLIDVFSAAHMGSVHVRIPQADTI